MKKIILLLALLTVLSANSVMAEETNTKLQALQQALAAKPDDAGLLNETGVALTKAGKYAEAEPLLQRSLKIREKESSQDSSYLASLHLNMAISSLAAFYDAQGKYKQAEPLYLRSVAIEEKNLKKDSITPFLHSDTLGLFYEKQLRYAEAEHFYQRSLATQERIYQHCLAKQEKSDKSDLLTNELIAVTYSLVAALDRLAGIYEIQAKYEKAESLYQRSLEIKEKTLGKDFPETTKSVIRLARVYRTQAKYEQAEPMYQKALATFEKVLVDSKDQPSGFRMKEGMAYEDMPHLSKLQLVMDRNNLAAILNELALLYDNQGRYAEAEPLYLRSIAIHEKNRGKDTPDAASPLDNLASLYEKQGKYKQAERLHQKALELREKALGKDHPDVAISLNNLAFLYDAQGKYTDAEPLYSRSIAIDEKALGKDHPRLATGLNNLAALYYSQGKFDAAEPLLQRSLAIRKKALGNNHFDVASTLKNLAMLYSAEGKLNKAEPLLQRSLRIMNQSLERWLWGAGEKTRQAYLQQQENNREIYLSFYSLHNTPEEALYFSLARKSLLLRIASEASTLAKQSSDSAIQKQKQEFDALRTQLASLAFSGKADKAEIQILEDKANELERQLSQKVAGFKRSKTEVTPKEVLKKLRSKQVLVDFLVYKEVDLKTNNYKTEQVIALVADKKSIQLIKLGEFAPIATAIKTYQAAIVPTKDNVNSREQTLKQTAQTLYNQLWRPLMPHLKDKTTVYLVPDGDLNLLPFKALQDAEGHYLAEKQQLIMLSSARDIVLPPLTGKSQAAAIFAAPDYGDSKATANSGTRAAELQNLYFSPLPNALNEGQQINRLFSKKAAKSPAKLFLKKDATEQAIKAVTSPKILHLATHGFFLEDQKFDDKALEKGLTHGTEQNLPAINVKNPLTRSGLAFVGANLGEQSDQNDGILTALEVLNLKLESTDLVTLSACETGRGDVKIGEGVYSLNRAFQEAGAKAVLSTLWSVDDEATGEFMQKFYDRFLNGKPAQQAIQETQNEFMKHEKYSNPFYWAGFVMMGKE